MLPALPALLALSLALLAAPFPWVDSAGLPPASPAAAATAPGTRSGAGLTPEPAGVPAGTGTGAGNDAVFAPFRAPDRPEGATPSAAGLPPGTRSGAGQAPAARRTARLGPAGPVPAVVGPVLLPFGPFPIVVGPELGRYGRSSATAPSPVPEAPAPPAAPAAVPVPVPVPLVPVTPIARDPAPTAPPTAPPAPPPVAPGVEVDPAGGEWLRRRAAEALAQVSYPWRDLGYEVAFLPAHPGLRARTLLRETRVEVFARRSDTARQTAFDLAHEIAHAVDFQWLTWGARARWQEARGIPAPTAWFGCNACADLATPAGDFAESFAVWQVPGGPFASTLGPPPDETQRALLAELASR